MAAKTASSTIERRRRHRAGDASPRLQWRLLAFAAVALRSQNAFAHGGGVGEVLWLTIFYGAGAIGGFIAFLVVYRRAQGTYTRRLTVALAAWVLTFFACMAPVAMYAVPQLLRYQATGGPYRVPSLQQLSDQTRNGLQAQRNEIERKRRVAAIHREQYERTMKPKPGITSGWRQALRDERAALSGPDTDRFRSDPLRLKLCSPSAETTPVPDLLGTDLDEQRYFELGEIVDNCLDGALANSSSGQRRAVVARFLPLVIAMAHWRASRPVESAAADRVVIYSAINNRCQEAAVVARTPQ